jgi:hypothetical protein
MWGCGGILVEITLRFIIDESMGGKADGPCQERMSDNISLIGGYVCPLWRLNRCKENVFAWLFIELRVVLQNPADFSPGTQENTSSISIRCPLYSLEVPK